MCHSGIVHRLSHRYVYVVGGQLLLLSQRGPHLRPLRLCVIEHLVILVVPPLCRELRNEITLSNGVSDTMTTFDKDVIFREPEVTLVVTLRMVPTRLKVQLETGPVWDGRLVDIVLVSE